jgi:hypothetical protein
MSFPGWWQWWADTNKLQAVTDLFDSVSDSYVATNIPSISGNIKNKFVPTVDKQKLILSTLLLKFRRVEAFRPPSTSFYEIKAPLDNGKGLVTYSEIGPPLPSSDIWRASSPKYVFLNGPLTTDSQGKSTFEAVCVQQVNVHKAFDVTSWPDVLLSGVLQPGENNCFDIEYSLNHLAAKMEIIKPSGKSATSWYTHVVSHISPTISTIESLFKPKDIATLLGLKVDAKNPLLLAPGTDYLLWKITVAIDKPLLRDRTKRSYNKDWTDKQKAKDMQKWLDTFIDARVTPNGWNLSYNIDVSEISITDAPCYLMTNKLTMSVNRAFPPPLLPPTVSGTFNYSTKNLTSTTQQHGVTTSIKTIPGKAIVKNTKARYAIKATAPFVYMARARWDSIFGESQTSTAIGVYVSPVPLDPAFLEFQADTQSINGLLEPDEATTYVQCGFAYYRSAHAPKFAIEHVVLTNTHWTDYINYFIEHGYPPVDQTLASGRVDYTNYGKDYPLIGCANWTAGTADFLDPISVVALKKLWKLPYASATWHVYLLRHRWDAWGVKQLKLELKNK